MASRSERLLKYLSLVERGKRTVDRVADAKLLLEAICDQPDRLRCVERVLSSPSTISALQKSFRVDLSNEFVNGPVSEFLTYIQDPSIESFCNGQFSRKIVAFINTFVGAYQRKLLTEKSSLNFAWVLLSLLKSPACPDDILQVARTIVQNRSFVDSSLLDIRTIGYKIDNILKTLSAPLTDADGYRPGGRHDNDLENFREISILPTPDELASTELPFYRRADEIYLADSDSRPTAHYDNQFRLLREDMLAELRDDLQVARGQKKGRRSGYRIDGLVFKGVDCGDHRRRKQCCLTFFCQNGLPGLAGLPKKARKKILADKRAFVKHQAFGCLLEGRNIVAFGTVDLPASSLLDEAPLLALCVMGRDGLNRVFTSANSGNALTFIVVNTAVFAYEPILQRLQEKTEFPMANTLLSPEPSQSILASNGKLTGVIERIKACGGNGIGAILGTKRKVDLDGFQSKSLLSVLEHEVSTIHGPPGTGKSFIGALSAKALHDFTDSRILVLCYTNQALDQFLEDLMDIGIPDTSMVRLGSKSTSRTKKLGLFEQQVGFTGSDAVSWRFIDTKKQALAELEHELKAHAKKFSHARVTNDDILEYLEFSDESAFFDAFQVPEEKSGMQRVGKKGKAVNKYYLLERWVDGHDAGALCCADGLLVQMATGHSRRAKSKSGSLIEEYNRVEKELDDYFYYKKNAKLLQAKRIIACTTTAAAKYSRVLQTVKPGVILVEEAGEILESHILTAMTADTQKLVLIGDHKQLRPKINNYNLSVEKGDGFDLNRSLFERLVLNGFPHTSLSKQHRMRPDISCLIQHLTYPDLQDAEKTQNRPQLRGFQNSVIFVNHDHLESDLQTSHERQDPTAKCSKQNLFEVEMVLKVVRYLGQQGYGTDKIVILTPYLGQLSLLRRKLSETNDPILNDLDSSDLVRAGLLDPGSAKLAKQPIQISTIDNYQGKEIDIVVASLTRGNESGDIGFMAAPERVNVLLSRARNALIMIGNAETFLSSRKGKSTWQPLLELLRKNGHVYEGFPLKCERHPKRKITIRNPDEFDAECPEGGCLEPCSSLLSCGLHKCTRQCHRIDDHSKTKCMIVIKDTCPKAHKYSWRCYENRPKACHICLKEALEAEKRKARDVELETKRQANQSQHAAKLAEIDQKIDEQKQILKDIEKEEEARTLLANKSKELDNLKVVAERVKQQRLKAESRKVTKTGTGPSPNTQRSPDTNGNRHEGPSLPSGAKDEWERQKRLEGHSNDALDSLMAMIGLEEVKESFLSIKARVDTAVRQGASLKDERFSAALLGNAGTGKTTAARLYAKFLSSVGVIPGSHIVETSGSNLACAGVPGCKKHLDEIRSNGGGALFIDEAYQLTSGSNLGGGSVLDFLLAEVENLTGKIVFIIAGYNKNMETFFAHNPGIRSRFPVTMQFSDYGDGELQSILRHRIDKKYDGRMKVEGGMSGLYARIVARRIRRGRGRDGFGNARTVHSVVAGITARQARRLHEERRARKQPDDMLLTKEDLLGPEPSAVLTNNTSWAKLHNLTGLESVKQSIQTLLNTIQFNYQRELGENPLVEYSLNKVFVGNPGTGKTTVAKLYGQILADMGFLSNGEVVVKNPSDFVGNALGASETMTKGILASTVGKVLVIDEAYMLAGNSSASGGVGVSDLYRAAVIDTLVAEVQSVPGDDRCVLLLGYKDQMENMFNDANPGLARRFPMSSAFNFEDYSDDDLQKILNLKLKQAGFDATQKAKKVVRECLARARNRPNFGNAGEVDILLDQAKARHQQRLSARQTRSIDVLEPLDFDPDFDRGERAEMNCRELFKGVVGCDSLIAQLEGYQRIANNLKKFGADPREQIPFSFLFRGPPGTGKTSTARRMGQIFYDMGLLATTETGPKTEKLLEKALGKVLFIDETYRLADGAYGKEAMDELVDCLTKPKYYQKLVTILAGYDEDINRLMASNPGLTSRFPETVSFTNLTPEQCWELFNNSLRKTGHIDVSVVHSPRDPFKGAILAYFEALSELPAWGNARDVQNIAKAVIGKVLSKETDEQANLFVTEAMVESIFRSTINERMHRATGALATPAAQLEQPLLTALPPNMGSHRHSFNTQTRLNTEIAQASPSSEPSSPLQPPDDFDNLRDPGVSDEVWFQLKADRRAMIMRERQGRDLLAQEQHARQQLEDLNSGCDEEGPDEEERRKYEELIRTLAKKKLEMEARKRKEKETQMKLMAMGACPMGYQWIKQATGYRCAGGSHFMSDAQLAQKSA
ncbi:hypothetical protein AJ80_01795 [Polytolypa hystricis UAMH7299]|uniref:AAA+ ATPase domain-containing protein n=1 Tax=Polytolypa hystricis (strain UAMH7299) TaxID=1447883 RepID=A0A2B7YZK1_POLH7|nr:hypothetical protein AJ80_01795 [Polytolypa hystricis UAMH7299]